MPDRKTFIDRLIEKLDRLDDQDLAAHLRALSRDKGLLENVFNSMREGLLVVDWQGKIVFLNYSASRLLGLPPESIGNPYTPGSSMKGSPRLSGRGCRSPGSRWSGNSISSDPGPGGSA